jgi:hypothetical protein
MYMYMSLQVGAAGPAVRVSFSPLDLKGQSNVLEKVIDCSRHCGASRHMFHVVYNILSEYVSDFACAWVCVFGRSIQSCQSHAAR